MNPKALIAIALTLIAPVIAKSYKAGEVPTDYSVITGYFKQDKSSTDPDTYDAITDDFGLDKGVSWKDVMKELNDKIEDADDDEIYKLLFLARHGEGVHNVAGDYYGDWWDCYWGTLNGNATVSWMDAELTATGVEQAKAVNTAWIDQVDNNNCPLPQSFYVSPLRRALQTYNYTWNGIGPNDPVVKEMLRETYGIYTSEERHSKSFIKENFPTYQYEDGFSENDELWEPELEESKQHRNYRGHLFLDDIFMNDTNSVISVTGHHELINSILKEINHQKFTLQPGQLLPVLVKAQSPGTYTKDLDKTWTTIPTCPSTSIPTAY